MKEQNLSTANKVIIFDSSTLINMVLNGLLAEFRELRKSFNGKFIITKEVMAEVIDKPMTIKRFKLEALKIKRMLDDGVIELPSALGIDEKRLAILINEIREKANKIFYANGNPIQIIHSGEISCLALGRLLEEKGVNVAISMDERTTRMLCEKPENLSSLLQKKLHTSVTANRENFSYFKNCKFIRSTELMYVAYKKGIINLKNHNVLDAILYALKMNGCSITDEEIAEMERLSNGAK